MTRDEIYERFKIMFPQYNDKVTGYEKIGSKSIALDLTTGRLVFLYIDDTNWSLGTKLYRMRPNQIPKG